MALCGVSVSDLKNYGFNTAVGAGVLVGCAVVASAAQKIAFKLMNTVAPTKDLIVRNKRGSFSQYLGLAAGVGAAAAAYKFVPASRFALIADASTSKMFKIGALQGIAGAIINNSISPNSYAAVAVGLGGALATRFGTLVLAGLGVVGAAIGSGRIER